VDAIDVVRRYIDLLGQRDLGALDEVVAEDVVVLYPDGSVAFSDRQSWKQAQHGSPFSDERITPVQIVSDGEQVAVRYTVTAVHTESEAFGIAPNNGTRLPYRQVGVQDWWVSDTGSPSYNRYAQCATGTCEFDEHASENLGEAGPAYEHAVVIDYNRQPVVAGAGSAFFLHVETGRPTAGCVSIPAVDLEAVMRWLDPSAHPVINIGSK